MYKGFLPLVLRDAPAWATYFWANEFLKEKLGVTEAAKTGDDWSTANLMNRLWCAGVAGQISWVVSYPFDIVKTEIQCTTSKKVTIREAFINGYRREGLRYFFKGMTPMLAMAFIVNMIALPTYEYMMQFGMP